jgi:hypothetical protein
MALFHLGAIPLSDAAQALGCGINFKNICGDLPGRLG